MAQSTTTGRLLAHALKKFLIALFRLAMLVLAWGLKLTGLLCTKLASLIERLIVKT